MNGIHDMGGLDGFGRVEVEADEPVFHHPWERAVFGISTAVLGRRIANVDAFRHAIERMDPVHYLASSYYEHWLTGAATLLVERGVVSAAELEARAGGAFPLAGPVRATRRSARSRPGALRASRSGRPFASATCTRADTRAARATCADGAA